MKKYKLLNTKTILFALGLSFLTSCTEEESINVLTGEEIPTIESSIENIEPSIEEPTIESTEVIEETSEDTIESIEIVEIPKTPIQIEEEKFESVDDKYNFVYFTKDTNIYDDINGNVIEKIEVYNKAVEIFAVDNWSLIEIEDSLYYVENKNIKYLGPDYVEIDIGDQNVKLFVGDEMLVDTDTVTGGKGHSTHIGLFEIWSMQHDRYLTGPGYKCWVSYFMPFDGGIGLHDATWRDEFGGEIYKKNGSHGCVNLPLEDAKIIYENVDVKTKVLVHN